MPTKYLINRTLYSPQISIPPNANLGIIVVIPCYNEDNLLESLVSLKEAELPSCGVEVIVLINDGQETSLEIKSKNKSTFAEAFEWAKQNSSIRKQFHILYHTDLPTKKAGVGLARKIGMDEAAFRLEAVNNPSGLIVGFDADSKCEFNYFIEIENHFKKNPSIQAASIWYEHPLSGTQFDEATYQAICEYELHLRYFTLVKRYANYPHAFETIGSSMAARSEAYQQQGGMNTRKAGEDFYFLNKFIVLGKLNELNSTTVIPSPRVSDRVPFGTGKAVGEIIEENKPLDTYAFQSFIDLKKMIDSIGNIYEEESFDWSGLPDSIQQFLESVNAEKRITEIKSNTTNFAAFEKRFFRWFDPFLVMKYVHYCRDQFYENISVKEAGEWVLKNYFGIEDIGGDEFWMLEKIRKCWKEKR